MSNELKPYPHQQETIDNLNSEFKKGNTKQLVVLPSGSGKTHTIAFHVKELRPGSFLYVVHRDHLVTQTIKVFRKTIPWLRAADIGIINAEHKDYDKPFLFATIQTLSKEKNLDKLSKTIGYMVIDEYHHVAADTYKKIVDYFTPKYLIGLTATPYRLDKKDIFGFVNNNVAHSIDVFEGISKKILVPFHYIGLHDNIDYKQIKFNGYSYNVSDLDRKLVIHKRDDAVIREYFDKIKPQNRLTIVFCNSVSHIKRMAKRFNKEKIRAAGIWHKQDSEEKSNIIELFRQGVYKVLLTRDILNEGIDFPECDALMFLRPTISKTVFFQQLGRGLRRKEGKEDVLVLDFVGNYHKAFEKKEWFLAVGGQREYTGQYVKPYYEYDHPSPVIEFDHKVIEIMDIQIRNRLSGDCTKEQLLEDYLNCCKNENKSFLTLKEWTNSEFRRVGMQSLYKQFEQFRFFIQEMMIPIPDNLLSEYGNPHKGFTTCKDKELLISNYYDVKKTWNENKTKTEFWDKYRRNMKKRPLSTRDLEELSKLGRGRGTGGLPIEIPPARLFDDYTISKYSASCYSDVFGHYRIFLSNINELSSKTLLSKDLYMKRHSSKEERQEKIKKAIKKLQEFLGREFFTASDWRNYLGEYATKEIKNDYGSFKEFRKHFGVPEGEEVICEICGKTKISTRKLEIKSCSPECYRKWVKKTRITPKLKAQLEEKMKIMTNCLYCGKQITQYILCGKNKNKLKRRSLCSDNNRCRNGYSYYIRKEKGLTRKPKPKPKIHN